MKRMVAIAILCVAGWMMNHAALAADEAAQPGAKKIELFNGKDLSGWTFCLEKTEAAPNPDAAKTFMVKDGVIYVTGLPKAYMRTTQKFKNFRLRLEWRWPATPANSGVFVLIGGEDAIWPRCIEAQLKHQNAGQIVLSGGSNAKEKPANSKAVAKKLESSEKPAGEWNTYEIVCKGDTVKLYVNGAFQNEITGCSETEGTIGLQSEGGPIEFRNLIVEPLGAEAKAENK